jgi:hypothetical protein
VPVVNFAQALSFCFENLLFWWKEVGENKGETAVRDVPYSGKKFAVSPLARAQNSDISAAL